MGSRQLLSAFRFLPSNLTDPGLGLFSLALYTYTLSPSLLPADAGEYQVVGAVLGVAHPPGFALYTLLSWLVARVLFFIPPALAINFLSALFAALTLVLLSRAVRALTRSAPAGICAALALGFSTTFWAQAVTANVRMPATFAVALALERLVAYRYGVMLSREAAKHLPTVPETLRFAQSDINGQAQSSRLLSLLALALGLGVAHHGSVVFIAAVLGLYALWLNPRVLLRPWPLLLGLLPFLFWLYFPLRAGAFGAPPRIATLDGFLEHVLARGFRGDILQFANARDLPSRLLVLGNILTFEFTWPLLALAAFGALAALRRDGPFGAIVLLAFVVHTFVSITYQSPQTVEYLLPSYLLIAALMGFAFAEIFRLPELVTAKGQSLNDPIARSPNRPITQSPSHLVTLSFSALILTPQFLSTFPSYLVLAHDTSTRDYAETVLTVAPPNALILASWHWATPMWYLQEVEGQRPDVEVSYVYPRTISLAQDWVGEITTALPAQSVAVTSFYPQAFNALTYRFLPLGPAWEVRAEPLMTPPTDLTGSQTLGDWAFLGYHLESSSFLRKAVPSVDQPLSLIAAWRSSGRPRDINFYLHLLGSDGQLYGQSDVSHPASRYISGEVLLDRYHIVPYSNAPSGDYTLVAGAYLPDGTRLAETSLTTITLSNLQSPISNLQPPTSRRPPERSEGGNFHPIPLGSSILLTRADISPSGPLRPGESVTVDLHFLATRPVTEDNAVKVDLIGPNDAWRAQSDGTPVGGAIPTLKWIAGSQVADRRTLSIPADAAPGTAQLVMALYDAFTQQNLPLLDPFLAALGPTAPLGSVEVVAP